MNEPAEDSVQRWTAKRRTALVLSIVKGETSVPEAARKHGLTVNQMQQHGVLGEGMPSRSANRTGLEI